MHSASGCNGHQRPAQPEDRNSTSYNFRNRASGDLSLGFRMATGAGTGAIAAATGDIGLIAIGGAINSGGNNVVTQLDSDTKWENINWGTVGGHAFWGLSISAVGAGISAGIDKTSWISDLLDMMNLNKAIARNVAGSSIQGMMVGAGTGAVAGAFKANVSKDWRDVFGGMLNGIIYGGGAGLASALIIETGYQLQLRSGQSPVTSSGMTEVVSSNVGEMVRNLDTPYMEYYWETSFPTLFKDYIQYLNDSCSPSVNSIQAPNLPSISTEINPVSFPY